MNIASWFARVRGALAGEEQGQTLVEYALILGTISIGVIVVMGLLRDELVQVFSNVISAF